MTATHEANIPPSPHGVPIPSLWLVPSPLGPVVPYVSAEEAGDAARRSGTVVVEAPIVADYRPPTRGETDAGSVWRKPGAPS